MGAQEADDELGSVGSGGAGELAFNSAVRTSIRDLKESKSLLMDVTRSLISWASSGG